MSRHAPNRTQGETAVIQALEPRRLLTTVAVDPLTASEGSGTAVFQLRLDTPSAQDLTLGVATLPGTARPGKDYQDVRSTVTIPAGQTTASIFVLLVSDTVYEGNETFRLMVSGPKSVTPRKVTANATIVDDDAKPTIHIGLPKDGTAFADEPVRGKRAVTLVVSLSAPATRPVKVDYASAGGSAESGKDYVPARGRVVFAPGQTSRTLKIFVNADKEAEGVETFSVGLANPSGDASIGTATQTITIHANNADGSRNPAFDVNGSATLRRDDVAVFGDGDLSAVRLADSAVVLRGTTLSAREAEFFSAAWPSRVLPGTAVVGVEGAGSGSAAVYTGSGSEGYGGSLGSGQASLTARRLNPWVPLVLMHDPGTSVGTAWFVLNSDYSAAGTLCVTGISSTSGARAFCAVDVSTLHLGDTNLDGVVGTAAGILFATGRSSWSTGDFYGLWTIPSTDPAVSADDHTTLPEAAADDGATPPAGPDGASDEAGAKVPSTDENNALPPAAPTDTTPAVEPTATPPTPAE
jgi:chitinase